MKYLALCAMCTCGLSLLSTPASATMMANCTPDFASCDIPENTLLELPFLAISGDAIVLDPNMTVSDVFRIFNNVFDSGGGTGFGDLVFLFSSDDSTPLPNPSTYSVNAVTIPEGPGGITDFIGNGTDYRLATPEPSTLPLLGLALLTLVGVSRRHLLGWLQ